MILSLYYGMIDNAVKWCDLCEENEINDYFDIILNIDPQTEFMVRYKKSIEQVKNMCNIEYVKRLSSVNRVERKISYIFGCSFS